MASNAQIDITSPTMQVLAQGYVLRQFMREILGDDLMDAADTEPSSMLIDDALRFIRDLRYLNSQYRRVVDIVRTEYAGDETLMAAVATLDNWIAANITSKYPSAAESESRHDRE